MKTDEDGQSFKFEREETVSGIYFFSSVFKQEKDLRFNKLWILSQGFIFRGNRYARRVGWLGGGRGGGICSTVYWKEKQLYEISTKKTPHTHPFISPLSVNFGLETCMMGVEVILHSRSIKKILQRCTLHLQMIKSVYSSLQRLTHACGK